MNRIQELSGTAGMLIGGGEGEEEDEDYQEEEEDEDEDEDEEGDENKDDGKRKTAATPATVEE